MRKMLYSRIAPFSFLSFFVVFISSLEAAEVTPWAEIKLQYDDNIFWEADDEKDDFIVTLSPGISIDCPISDNLLKFDYHAEVNKYTDYTSQDATNHFLSGKFELNLRDIKFKFYDDFKRVYERPSTEDTTRVKRDDNTIGIVANFQGEKLGIQLGYENFLRDYRSNETYEAYDRTEHIYSVMLTHQTFEETKLLFEYDFSQIRYNETTRSDANYHQFLLGAIGELTPKTTATIKTGYQTRDYERASEPDFETGVLYTDVVQRFSDKNALKVSFLRSAHESTYDVNNYYRVENITAIFDHYFNTRLLGFLNVLYQINAYPRETTEGTETKKRKDRYYSIGAGLRYYMREWLTLTLQIEHIVRDSNFGVYDFDQNLMTFTARAEF